MPASVMSPIARPYAAPVSEGRVGSARATSHAEIASEGIANSNSIRTHSQASRFHGFGYGSGVGKTNAVVSATHVNSIAPPAQANKIQRDRTAKPGTAC